MFRNIYYWNNLSSTIFVMALVASLLCLSCRFYTLLILVIYDGIFGCAIVIYVMFFYQNKVLLSTSHNSSWLNRLRMSPLHRNSLQKHFTTTKVYFKPWKYFKTALFFKQIHAVFFKFFLNICYWLLVLPEILEFS